MDDHERLIGASPRGTRRLQLAQLPRSKQPQAHNIERFLSSGVSWFAVVVFCQVPLSVQCVEDREREEAHCINQLELPREREALVQRQQPVGVLLTIYAKCVDGRDEVWFERIDRWLGDDA